MHHVQDMLRTSPNSPVMGRDELAACIQACFECTQSCVACADACLGETEHLAMLTRCIRLNSDCADICDVTGRALSRGLEPDVELLGHQLALCALACERCAEECERHAAQHEHCRVCAEACRRCLAACQAAAGALGQRSTRGAKH